MAITRDALSDSEATTISKGAGNQFASIAKAHRCQIIRLESLTAIVDEDLCRSPRESLSRALLQLSSRGFPLKLKLTEADPVTAQALKDAVLSNVRTYSNQSFVDDPQFELMIEPARRVVISDGKRSIKVRMLLGNASPSSAIDRGSLDKPALSSEADQGGKTFIAYSKSIRKYDRLTLLNKVFTYIQDETERLNREADRLLSGAVERSLSGQGGFGEWLPGRSYSFSEINDESRKSVFAETLGNWQKLDFSSEDELKGFLSRAEFKSDSSYIMLSFVYQDSNGRHGIRWSVDTVSK